MGLLTVRRQAVLPYLGRTQLAAVTPSAVRGWDRTLREAGLSERHRHTLFTNLSALFTAAQDDGLIARHLFAGKSLRKPKALSGSKPGHSV